MSVAIRTGFPARRNKCCLLIPYYIEHDLAFGSGRYRGEQARQELRPFQCEWQDIFVTIRETKGQLSEKCVYELEKKMSVDAVLRCSEL